MDVEDILVGIFSFLSAEDVGLKCALVCHTWSEAAASGVLWQRLLLRDYGLTSAVDEARDSYRVAGFSFDPQFCSPLLNIQDGRVTVDRYHNHYCLVYGSIGFSAGVHCWEVTLGNNHSGNTMVGVSCMRNILIDQREVALLDDKCGLTQ